MDRVTCQVALWRNRARGERGEERMVGIDGRMSDRDTGHRTEMELTSSKTAK